MLARLGSLAAVVCLFATIGRADIAPPPPPNTETDAVTTVVTGDLVVKDDAEGPTRLLVPKNFRVALSDTATEDEALAASSGSNWRTVVAGIALSLAVVSVVWLKRKPSKLVPAAAILLAVMAAGLAVADVPVPGRERGPRARRPIEKPKAPAIQIEYTADEGTTITLIRGKGFPR